MSGWKGIYLRLSGVGGVKHGAGKVSSEIPAREGRGKAKPEPRDPKKLDRGSKKRAQNETVYRAHFGLVRARPLKEY